MNENGLGIARAIGTTSLAFVWWSTLFEDFTCDRSCTWIILQAAVNFEGLAFLLYIFDTCSQRERALKCVKVILTYHEWKRSIAMLVALHLVQFPLFFLHGDQLCLEISHVILLVYEYSYRQLWIFKFFPFFETYLSFVVQEL